MPDADLKIRPAQRTDLSRIVDIYNQSIPGRLATADLTPVRTADRRHWLEQHMRPETPLLVACDAVSGEPAGWASLSEFYGRAAYAGCREVAVYVDSASQRHGIAHQLLQALLTKATDLRVHSVMAYVFSHNLPSIALFKRAGFKLWGHCPDIARLDGKPASLDILGLTLIPHAENELDDHP